LRAAAVRARRRHFPDTDRPGRRTSGNLLDSRAGDTHRHGQRHLVHELKYSSTAMCRNIKTLFNFEPPATDEEIHEASLQFVRKLSGFTHPSRANAAVFERSVKQVAKVARSLIDSLETDA